eukprot:13663904-Ditylum_brightwellii.AAC.1
MVGSRVGVQRIKLIAVEPSACVLGESIPWAVPMMLHKPASAINRAKYLLSRLEFAPTMRNTSPSLFQF